MEKKGDHLLWNARYFMILNSDNCRITYMSSLFSSSQRLHLYQQETKRAYESLLKTWSFSLKMSSITEAKSAVSCGFDHIYFRILVWKTSFIVTWIVQASPFFFDFGTYSFLLSLFNNTHTEELVLYWIQYKKIHWNTRLAASDVFHMFTKSIKFF